MALRSEDRLRPMGFPVLSEVMRDCLQVMRLVTGVTCVTCDGV